MRRQIIVLSLERCPDRKEAMAKEFEKANLKDYTFFPAFDGKHILNMAMNIPIIKGVGIGRKLQFGEMGIIMSHIAALKHAQICGAEEVIILEDDVTLCEDFDSRIDTLITKLPENWEYVYLAGHSDYVKIPMYNEPTVIPAPPMIGAFAYLVNKAGIDKLIKFCGEFTTTYDDMIMHKIKAGKLNGYLYLPFVVYHSGTYSLVWEKTPGHIAHNNSMHSSYYYFKNKL